jgi:FtsZ-binding cell division protein ZapB
MLTPDLPRRRWRGLFAIAVMSAAMALPASSALAADPVAPDLEPPDAEAVTTQLDTDELQSMIDELGVANETLQAEADSLQASIDVLTQERDQLQSSLQRFDRLRDPIEADRQLLFELRKGMPDTRPEAEAQLERLSKLALAANPGQLGQLVDRVEAAAPAYLDWRFTEFGSTQEATAAYVNTGANAFDSSMSDFRSEVLLSVANRLDGLLTTLERLR